MAHILNIFCKHFNILQSPACQRCEKVSKSFKYVKKSQNLKYESTMRDWQGFSFITYKCTADNFFLSKRCLHYSKAMAGIFSIIRWPKRP